jgi:hypothetical protein
MIPNWKIPQEIYIYFMATYLLLRSIYRYKHHKVQRKIVPCLRGSCLKKFHVEVPGDQGLFKLAIQLRKFLFITL